MLQEDTKSGKYHHNKIRMDQQESGQAMLFLGYYDINEVEVFKSSATKLVLLIGQKVINQATYLCQHVINLSVHRWNH